MDFFGRQEQARRATRWLVFLFVLALVAVVIVVDAVVLGLATIIEPATLSPRETILWTSLAVVSIVGLASLYKTAQLGAGGGQIAQALGGRRVLPATGEVLERRLLNVVEEMAIASGTPVPEVYVLDNEAGINAFAAGWGPADAAVAVTRGALLALDRDELQGVVGHEFSHILNGDMRLNTRLVGLLFGLMILVIAGRLVLYHLPRSRGRGSGASALAAVGGVAVAAILAGSVGHFCGRLIQAAVARSRERLADAAAIQFTRQSTGLRDALVKIGASPAGSRIVEPAADEIAHMLFAQARRSSFATHPPLLDRIRALDPGFDPAEFGAMRRRLEAREPVHGLKSQARAVPARERLDDLLGMSVAVPLRVAEHVGRPEPAHLDHAAALRKSLPAEVHAAEGEPGLAAALLLALAVERDPEARRRQLAVVGSQLGDATGEAVARGLAIADSLHLLQRMPALLTLLPASHRLPRDERERLTRTLAMMLNREGGRISTFAYALRRLALVHLQDEIEPRAVPPRLARAAARMDAALLLAVLARVGHDDEADARLAFSRGMQRWGGVDGYAPADNWPARLDHALNRLDRLAPADKADLVNAMVDTTSHDNRLTLAEAELLRALCGALHCPLPPLIPSLIPPLRPSLESTGAARPQ